MKRYWLTGIIGKTVSNYNTNNGVRNIISEAPFGYTLILAHIIVTVSRSTIGNVFNNTSCITCNFNTIEYD